jgi:hypothetical protein
MAQLRFGCVDAFVAGLDDTNDLGEIVLCGGRFLGGGIGG